VFLGGDFHFRREQKDKTVPAERSAVSEAQRQPVCFLSSRNHQD
jgi:hypothetical protein